MKKNYLSKAIFLLVFAGVMLAGARPFFCLAADTYQGSVTDISDSKYFDAVHEAIIKAKSSIYVSMFLIVVNENDKSSLPYLLVQDLLEAYKRGVKVLVRLDKSYDYEDAGGAGVTSRKNDDAYLEFSGAGIDCKFTAPGKTLHDKLIVVDEELVIEGSMNWYSRALKLNRESATLIKSREYAKEKIERIKALETAAEEKPDRFQVETVAVRNAFLRSWNLGERMVRGNDERAFDAYLLFLKDFQEKGQARFQLDYQGLAGYLGLGSAKGWFNRWQINRMLKRLRDNYGLIGCKISFKQPAEITILDYEDKSKEYALPQKAYFKLPKAFWEYSWSRKLDLKTKYAYLICVYRTELSDIKPWWSLPLNLLAEDFHLGKNTIVRGMRNLKKLGLIEVEYSDVIRDKGSFISRKPNKYRLRLFLSEEEIARRWERLADTYGDMAAAKARKLAFMIEEGNDPEAVEDFIRIMERYGEKGVGKATKLVAKMHPDNPARNRSYIVGILKNWEEERR